MLPRTPEAHRTAGWPPRPHRLPLPASRGQVCPALTAKTAATPVLAPVALGAPRLTTQFPHINN